MSATVLDRTRGERALHHVQILVLILTLIACTRVPVAFSVLLLEVVLYRRVRPWFRALVLVLGVLAAVFALTSEV